MPFFRGDTHHDPVAQHAPDPRNRGTISAALPDDWGRCPGNSRFIYTGYAFNNIAVRWDNVPGFADHAVAFLQQRGWDALFMRVDQAPGHGFPACLAQSI